MMILILLLAILPSAVELLPFGMPATTVYRQAYGPPPALLTLGSMPFPQLYSAVQSHHQGDHLQFNTNQQQQNQQRFYQQPRFGAVKSPQHQQQYPQQQRQPTPIPPAPVKLGQHFQQQQQYQALGGRPTEFQQQKESSIGPEGKDFLASLQIIDTSGKARSLQEFGIGGGASGQAYDSELERQLLSIFSTIQQDLKGAAYLPLNLGSNQHQTSRQLEPIAADHQTQLGYSFKQPAQHQFQYLKPVRAASKTAPSQEPVKSPAQMLRAEGAITQEQQQLLPAVQPEKNIKSPVQVVRNEQEPKVLAAKRPLLPPPVLAQKELVAPPPRVEQKMALVERKPLVVEALARAPEQQQQQLQQGFDDDLNDKNPEQALLKEPIQQQKEINIEVDKQQSTKPIKAPLNQQQQRYNNDAPMNGWVPLLQTFPVDQKALEQPQAQFVEQIREPPPSIEEPVRRPIVQLSKEEDQKQVVGQQEEQHQLQEEQKVDSFGDSERQQEPKLPSKSIKRVRAGKVSKLVNMQSNQPRASNIYQQQQRQIIQPQQQAPNFQGQKQIRENSFQQQQQVEQFLPEQRQEEQLSAILEQQREDMLQQQRDLAGVQNSRKQEELSLKQQQQQEGQGQELQAPTTTAAPITPSPARPADGVKGRVKLITDKTRPSPIQRMRDQQLKAQKLQQQLEQSKRPRELTSPPRPIVQRPQEELLEQVKEEPPKQEEIRQQQQEESLVPTNLIKGTVKKSSEKTRIIPSFQEQQQQQIQKQIQQQQLQEQQLPEQAPEFNEQSQQQKQEFNEERDLKQQQPLEDLGQQKEEPLVQSQEQGAGEQRDELSNNQQGVQQQQQEEQQPQQKEELSQQQQEEQVQRKEEQQPVSVVQKDEIDQQQQREEQQQQKEDQQQQQDGFSEQPRIGQRDEMSQQQQKEELNQQREELSQQKEDQQAIRATEVASQQQEDENVQLKEEPPKQEQQQPERSEEGPSSQRSETTTTSTTTTSTTTTGSSTTELSSSQQPIELTSQQEEKQDQLQQEEVEKKTEAIKAEEQPVNQTFGQEQKSELTTVKSSQLVDEEPVPILTTTQRPPTRVRASFFKKLDAERFGKQKLGPSQGKREEVLQEVTISTTSRPKDRIIKGLRQQQHDGQKRGLVRNWATYSTRPRSNENFQPQERDNNEGILSANQLLNTYNPLQFEPERISSLNNRATENSPQNTNVNSSPSGESY